MQHGVVKCRIGRVSVHFPISIGKIELDAAANRFFAVQPDRGVGKIRSGFAIPGSELHDFQIFAGDGAKENP